MTPIVVLKCNNQSKNSDRFFFVIFITSQALFPIERFSHKAVCNLTLHTDLHNKKQTLLFEHQEDICWSSFNNFRWDKQKKNQDIVVTGLQ